MAKSTLSDNFFHYARCGKYGPRDVKLKLYPVGAGESDFNEAKERIDETFLGFALLWL